MNRFALACLLALPSAAALAQVLPRGGEPAVQRHVIEDDAVRIDELKVRGETRSVTVTPKARGFSPYAIQPGGQGRDPSQHRDGAGQRVWRLFSF